MITIDPSKHCHAVKLLGDKADDCEKHVEELTWQLDDDKCRQSLTSNLPVLNGSRSKNEKCKFPPSTSKRLDSSLRISAESEKPKKGSPVKPKLHASSNNHVQQEVESGRFKKQKLDSSPDKRVKFKKQKITEKQSASVSRSHVDNLSNDKNLKSTEVDIKFGDRDNKKLGSVKSRVQLNGGLDYRSKEETGVVSFIDEAETNESFSPSQKMPLSCPRQESVYTEFESCLLYTSDAADE